LVAKGAKADTAKTQRNIHLTPKSGHRFTNHNATGAIVVVSPSAPTPALASFDTEAVGRNGMLPGIL
jgi:hypothetical protein